jgi:hypothetical protein
LLIFIHLNLSLILLIIHKVWPHGKIKIDVTFKPLTPKGTDSIIHPPILRDLQPQANFAGTRTKKAETAKA